VRRDFDAHMHFCNVENIVRVRAILQWDVPPPPNTPNHVPVWGNVMNVQVQIHKREWMPLGDLIKELEHVPVKIPDPIGPVIKGLDPTVKLTALKAPPLTLAQKVDLYKGKDVPVHRFAFPEAQQLLKMPNPAMLASPGASPLVELGLSPAAVEGLIASLFATDGDTSYEELRCVGLHPESDLIEAVLTVKKPTGYCGGLCGNGSTEYVAFWICRRARSCSSARRRGRRRRRLGPSVPAWAGLQACPIPGGGWTPWPVAETSVDNCEQPHRPTACAVRSASTDECCSSTPGRRARSSRAR
jgi:hypothetical protein